MTPQLKNIVWSVSKDGDDDDYTPSYDVKDVFWLQDKETTSFKAENIPDGEYPFYTYEARIGVLVIENGMVIPESVDKWFNDYKNDHIFMEGMTMNPNGLVEIHFGS